ncbi:hypothetical protein [Streptomyces laurentii]|uniref:hypothetical protein n=1 Tax=Streptomyces laurentii TaxID=39478 RepID=UPI00340547BB
MEDVYDTGCGGQRRQCGGVLATADTLYLATHKAGGPDSIHAFDTLTGKRKWSFTPDTERSRTMIPVQTDGGGLIVHMLPTSSLGGEVLRLAEADGTATLLMKLPDPEGFGADTPDSQMMDADVDEPLYYEDQTLFKHIHGSFDHDFIGAPMTIALTSR